MRLIFEDTFDHLSAAVWRAEVSSSGDGNREFQAYVDRPENAYIDDDGSGLVITPTLTPEPWASEMTSGTMEFGEFRQATEDNVLPPVFSAKLTTKDTFSFLYGRVEFEARIPSGKWEWPALWLMPVDSSKPWPAGGEIDVMEARGNVNYTVDGVDLGNDVFSSTLHWGPDVERNGYAKTTNSSKLSTNGYHIFGLHWTPSEIFTYLDSTSNVILRANLADLTSDDYIQPFDKPFYLIMNVAVGGTSLGPVGSVQETGYWPDAPDKPWRTSDPFPQTSFYRARDEWYPSWDDGRAAMRVKSLIKPEGLLEEDALFEHVSSFARRRTEDILEPVGRLGLEMTDDVQMKI
ncbi:hypothetical protein CTAYLR_009169 [Chrysophaeum taylorii]|uniref:GH16 domain-containing protein n=1 Tax=Chrysophaeum taylorii TaxID=2483200 RepID=A0AAD7ULC1_9STRA|nr:hypothetical protein CTAYLR_009169 [Chrysophaeum taylorii]